MTSPLERARQILADPRPPDWLTAPGQAAEIIGILRGLVLIIEGDRRAFERISRELSNVARDLNTLTAHTNTVQAELDRLAENAGNVLRLHENSADGTCSSCRIPYPCHTRRAITMGVTS